METISRRMIRCCVLEYAEESSDVIVAGRQTQKEKKTLVFESAHPNLVVRRVAIDQNAVVVRVDLHFLAVHLVVTPFPRFYDQVR